MGSMADLKLNFTVEGADIVNAYFDTVALAIHRSEIRNCRRWLDDLGVSNNRHRWAIETTLRDLNLYGNGFLTREDVERIALFLGYPTRWHRFCRWFRAFWLEPRW